MKQEITIKINKLLIKISILFIILILILIMKIGFSFNKIKKIEKKNAKLEQQIIDYKWQLDQISYIIKCQRGE